MSSPDSSSSSAPSGSSGGQPSVAWIIVGGVLVFIAILVAFRPGSERGAPAPPEPVATEPAGAGPSVRSTPKPALAEPFPGESPTPTASPTPATAAESCVAMRWNAELHPGSQAEVPVAVTVENQCPHRLESLNLSFQVNGSLGGEAKGSAQGSFSGSLDQGASAVLNIRLPGVAGGYDSIAVVPVVGAG